MMYNSSNKAFTLIELSIVLIIISLIVGGVVSGKSLIRSAEIRSVISEYSTYQTAYNSFIMQYDSIPGDMANASEYWPGVAADGNGNGRNYVFSSEGVNAWHHLSLAELVNGAYPGGAAAFGINSIVGVTVPDSGMKNRGWSLLDTGMLHGRQGMALGFMIPKAWPGSIYYPFGASLIPKDAISIDKKFDDGNPRSGLLYIGTGIGSSNILNGPLCVSNVGVMNLSATTVECGLAFWLE